MKKIFIFALIIRLICLYLFKNITNYDLQSYVEIGALTLKGINIYPNIANLHHPYLPFFLYLEALAFYFKNSVIILKLINILFDLGILYLVYLLSKKNLKTAFIYAINPVTILITTLHGQFDVIPIFFILLAIYLLKIKNQFGSVLSFSFAILTKTWPVLFLIPIIKGIKNKKILILIAFFPILFTLFYTLFFKSSVFDIGKTLIYYQGLWGIWGSMSLIGQIRPMWQKLTTLSFLISFFTYSWFMKKAGKNLIKEFLNLLFFFFVFTTNFSIQYFAWIMPFLILIKPRFYISLIILIIFYLFSFYYFWLFGIQLILIQNILGFILWLSFIKVGYLSSKKS